MADDLAAALAAIDAALLGQNLEAGRAESLADEVFTLNERVGAFARDNLDFYDDPAVFQAVLRQEAWTPPSKSGR